VCRTEERPHPVLGEAGRSDVLLEVTVQIVVGRHRVLLAALLIQPDPAAAPLHKVVLNLHRNRGAHARKGVDHQVDQCPIAQAGREVVSIASSSARASSAPSNGVLPRRCA
jgi:hypothetical protein